MQVKANDLYSEMQAMMRQAQAPEMRPDAVPVNSAGDKFGGLLQNAIDGVNDVQSQAGQLRTAFEMGDRNVSLGDVMIASQKSSVAFQATVQVRNKLVEAYKEIMNMPV
ncbi:MULTISPECIES: flagellar hook-basal body complex protein FliE [Corallincola]|uniref:Flagellar hook-basal body complex protein FliE n=3 Tax=Corallincola TaxID=1775176 RepID=A0A368N227_9GAMM|nr:MULTISPECIES: flagellar hook-basal body complex protein FliE [Corallincola]RCU44572.1 flagellar hook-basal body complex protein FliE [Corallincola holothuriorum]TAA40317.1 flagellar hook-basal body complex protein FliE [Corallincola spongiicola]TCI05376.1 flagellar hook-basal body complex protein FliE [Corallincola luteus]